MPTAFHEDAALIRLYLGPAAVEAVEDHLLGAERIHLSWHTPNYALGG